MDKSSLREQYEAQLHLQSVALEAAANGIVITDITGKIIWVNPAFTRITGYQAEEVLEQNTRLLKSGKHSTELYQKLWETVLNGQVWHGELINRRKDGTLYYEEQTIAPVMDNEGRVTHFIAIKHDVTRRKEFETALQKRSEEIITLNRVMQTLSASLELTEVLNVILTELKQVVPYESASILSHKSNVLEAVAVHGYSEPDKLIGTTCELTEKNSPNTEVIRRKEPVIIHDTAKMIGSFPQHNFQELPVHCWLGVPMTIGERIIGMITLDTNEPGFYTEEHGRLAVAFAAQAAIAVENARLYTAARMELKERIRAELELRKANDLLKVKLAEIEALQDQLREQAIKDSLTGLYNRRYLDELLERELAQALRSGEKVSLVMLDIDHFKIINDTHGHHVGDMMLKELGSFLLSNVRKGDIACRFGGEEFTVVMPGVGLDVAVRRVNDWREEFRYVRMNYAGHVLQATFSAGIATFPDHCESVVELLIKADQALYAAKSGGRNRVISAGTWD